MPMVWRLQRTFYGEQGIEAWTRSNVPQAITTGWAFFDTIPQDAYTITAGKLFANLVTKVHRAPTWTSPRRTRACTSGSASAPTPLRPILPWSLIR